MERKCVPDGEDHEFVNESAPHWLYEGELASIVHRIGARDVPTLISGLTDTHALVVVAVPTDGVGADDLRCVTRQYVQELYRMTAAGKTDGAKVETHRPSIAIDVDGVLADYSMGWKGSAVLGFPNPGAKEFLEALRDAGWHIIVHTTRGKEIMEWWLQEHGLHYDDINENPYLQGENPGKPIATIYLDDRAIQFRGDFQQALREIKRFRVWY